MATTTNYGWTTPDDTALVKDGAAAIRTLGSSVDTTTKNLNPETTLGDLAYRSSTANVKTRLALGTANQQLRVNSGATAPEWFTPTASGGMVLINTGGTTLTGASVTISSIPSTYKNLELIIQSYKPATDNSRLAFRLNGDSGANRYGTFATVSGGGAFSSTLAFISQDGSNTVDKGQCVTTFYNYTNATTYKAGFSQTTDVNSGATNQVMVGLYTGVYNQLDPITSITLLAGDGGNLTSGTAYLYGVS